jgi:ketose-bisphosphate aldolase
MHELLARALSGGYAVGYYEAWDQYSLEACLEAAEHTRSPVILGFGGAVADPAWLDRWGIEEMATLARRLAEAASVPAAVLFNEARTLGQIRRGLDAGCNAVMLDTSRFPLEENLSWTRKVVALAAPFGADVEVELGHLPDARDPSERASMTDPEEAARFVARCGVQALAVSVGSVHSLAAGGAALDLQRLEAIHAAVPVPLVLHGGTGIPLELIPQAAARGVAKVNYGMRMKLQFLEGMKTALNGLPPNPDIHAVVGSRQGSDVLGRAQARVRELLENLMRAYGSAGRADSP